MLSQEADGLLVVHSAFHHAEGDDGGSVVVHGPCREVVQQPGQHLVLVAQGPSDGPVEHGELDLLDQGGANRTGFTSLAGSVHEVLAGRHDGSGHLGGQVRQLGVVTQGSHDLQRGLKGVNVGVRWHFFDSQVLRLGLGFVLGVRSGLDGDFDKVKVLPVEGDGVAQALTVIRHLANDEVLGQVIGHQLEVPTVEAGTTTYTTLVDVDGSLGHPLGLVGAQAGDRDAGPRRDVDEALGSPAIPHGGGSNEPLTLTEGGEDPVLLEVVGGLVLAHLCKTSE